MFSAQYSWQWLTVKKNAYVTCTGVLTIQLVILNTFTQLNRSQRDWIVNNTRKSKQCSSKDKKQHRMKIFIEWSTHITTITFKTSSTATQSIFVKPKSRVFPARLCKQPHFLGQIEQSRLAWVNSSCRSRSNY